MHDGMTVTKKTGFVQRRITSNPNPRPAPKYYELVNGGTLPADIGPDDLQNAIKAGVGKLVSAPPVQAETVPTDLTIVTGLPISHLPETLLSPKEQARLKYEAAIAEIELAEQVAREEEEQAAQAELTERDEDLTAAGVLEDLVYYLKQENSYLVDGAGKPVSGLRIVVM